MSAAESTTMATKRETVATTVTRFAPKLAGQPALVVGEQSLSWQELDKQINRVANCLRALGYGRGNRIAILATNRIEYYVCLLGTIKIAACAVPLPAMVSAVSLSKMLTDSQSRVLFSCSALQEKADAALAIGAGCSVSQKIGLDFAREGWIEYERWLEGASDQDPGYSVMPEDEFNIIYSSGTTGTPKGIVHTHEFRCGDALSLKNMGFSENKITIITTVLYSNWSVYAFLATLQSGGVSVVMPKFDLRAFLSLCERWRPDNVFLVPVQCERLLASAFFSNYELGDTTTKWVAGSAFDSRCKAEMLDRWPGRLMEMYGMTEGTPSTILDVQRYPEKLGSVGLASEGCTLRILDDLGQIIGPGEVGEVVGHGSAMMKGYNKLPQQTAELEWRDDAGRRFFRSGDLGYLDSDGFLYIIGRKKDMIVSGGFNVYPVDLETVLHRHPEVLEAAVIGVPCPTWGETPLAVILPKTGATIAPELLRQWANEQLGKHQRLSKVEFVECFPRGPTGKILKRELRSHFLRQQEDV